MAHRYLNLSQAENTLNRGKSIECFLGPVAIGNLGGIKWFSVSCVESSTFTVRVYVSADQGNADFVDIYSFGPLDDERDFDEADEIFEYVDYETLWVALATRFPSSLERLVNVGVLQDEYLDFKSAGLNDSAA